MSIEQALISTSGVAECIASVVAVKYNWVTRENEGWFNSKMCTRRVRYYTRHAAAERGDAYPVLFSECLTVECDNRLPYNKKVD